MKREKFSEQIDRSAKDLMRSRREGAGFLHYAYVLGVGGWLLVLPIIGGAALGRYLDGRFESGVSWTLTCIVAGVAVGVYNAWYFYVKRFEK
jgi:ATP synthase protein I